MLTEAHYDTANQIFTDALASLPMNDRRRQSTLRGLDAIGQLRQADRQRNIDIARRLGYPAEFVL